jgi:hypothetical protein
VSALYVARCPQACGYEERRPAEWSVDRWCPACGAAGMPGASRVAIGDLDAVRRIRIHLGALDAERREIVLVVDDVRDMLAAFDRQALAAQAFYADLCALAEAAGMRDDEDMRTAIRRAMETAGSRPVALEEAATLADRVAHNLRQNTAGIYSFAATRVENVAKGIRVLARGS